MNLSIRNQLAGTVSSVTPGEVMAAVKIRLTGGQEITAAITLEAVWELGIAAGTAVNALVKSTEVALATGVVEGVSIRNQLPGTVTGIKAGDAMASVKITVPGGELTSAVTEEAVTDLGLVTGSTVVALIKSTEVSLATV
ncbi:TOBE domain-containing protein [Streptomyces sp. NBC_00370]|uniref:TOBE domain-containing protein n=1 Tax=Streptomyces sp. NBC_00370 TaxID=2975728 RepID=UPI002E26832E